MWWVLIVMVMSTGQASSSVTITDMTTEANCNAAARYINANGQKARGAVITAECRRK